MMVRKKKIEVKQETDNLPKVKIKAVLQGERVISEDRGTPRELYDHSRYGEPKEGNIQYALVEALLLLEKGRMNLKDENKKKIDFETFVKLARKTQPNFWIRYVVYRDMRNRGYIVKTALKFGADFRVYDRGIKPGEDHAKWVLYPVHETLVMPMYEFSAKNRVAHSTRKRLLMGIVDDENDVTYYQIVWTRP
jgi:tRNA-intron endonuclease, archaea type